jgi:hypothetical protein
MPFGLILTTAAIMLMFLFSANKLPADQWMIWAAISAATFVVGLIFLGSSLIHKIKSDLIKKSSRRKMTSPVIEEEQHVG